MEPQCLVNSNVIITRDPDGIFHFEKSGSEFIKLFSNLRLRHVDWLILSLCSVSTNSACLRLMSELDDFFYNLSPKSGYTMFSNIRIIVLKVFTIPATAKVIQRDFGFLCKFCPNYLYLKVI